MYSGEIRSAFDLSHGEFGTVYAIGTLVSGLLLIWAGKLIDIIDLRIYAVLLCIAMAAACMVMSYANGVIMLTVAIFLLRIVGQGLLSQTALVTMARYFDEHSRGRAVSLVALGFPTGQAIFPAIAVMLMGLLSWREVWATSALALLVLVPPCFLWLLKGHRERHKAFLARTESRSDRTKDTLAKHWTRSQVLRDPRFTLAMVAMMCTAFIITGLNLHQVHLVQVKNWELSFYASCFAIYAVFQVGVSLLTGMLVDRFGALRLTPFYLFPMSLSTLVIAVFDTPYAIIAFMALAGTTGGAGATIISTMWAELYGVLHLGSIKAMVAGIQVISSALGPAVFGLLIDYGIGIESISIVCSVYSIGSCFLLAVLFRPRMLLFWRI